MLSMFKDSSGKTVLNVKDCNKLSEVKVVVMKNLGLIDFDQHMFSQMDNVEEMDISGNSLDSIPESINLPKLKKLNCSNNKFSDVMFVQMFPCLEEVDFTGNDITFPDFCIAYVLRPSIKRINNQDVDFKDLDVKMENRLKPLINQVWAKHFNYYNDSTSNEEFEAMSQKFRIMLKHANIKTTKLVRKFKDFKLLQLIDQFLEDVRTKPGHGRSLTKQYQRKLAAPAKKFNDSTTKEEKIHVIVNKEDGSSETLEMTVMIIGEPENKPTTNKVEQIFEDEVSNKIVEKSSSRIQTPTSDTSTAANTEKKVKYWLYDEKSVPKKKEPKKAPKRQSSKLKQYIVGTVSNNKKEKSTVKEKLIQSSPTVNQSKSDIVSSDNSSTLVKKEISKNTTVGPLKKFKKRVRFQDDAKNQEVETS